MQNQKFPELKPTKELKLFIKALTQYVASDRMYYFMGRDFALLADTIMHERLAHFVTGYNEGLAWLAGEFEDYE